MDAVFKHLEIVEKEYFGLQFIENGLMPTVENADVLVCFKKYISSLIDQWFLFFNFRNGLIPKKLLKGKLEVIYYLLWIKKCVKFWNYFNFKARINDANVMHEVKFDKAAI